MGPTLTTVILQQMYKNKYWEGLLPAIENGLPSYVGVGFRRGEVGERKITCSLTLGMYWGGMLPSY
jgi:hypothetical protein